MTFCRFLSSVSFAAMLAVAAASAAQAQFGGMPGMPGMGMPGAPGAGGFGGPPAAPPPACQQLIALRDERTRNMEALQAARGKADPMETCKMFRTLMSTETKFIQGMKANSAQCGVPPEVIKQADDGHKQGMQIAKQVCDVAEHPRPSGPTLSDALNSNPVLPDAGNTKTGHGTYDTLQGNALAR